MKKQTKKIRKTQEGEKRRKQRRKKKKKQQKQKELFRLGRSRKHHNNEYMTCNSSPTLRLTGHEVRDRPFG